jgi:hypothetical protein
MNGCASDVFIPRNGPRLINGCSSSLAIEGTHLGYCRVYETEHLRLADIDPQYVQDFNRLLRHAHVGGGAQGYVQRLNRLLRYAGMHARAQGYLSRLNCFLGYARVRRAGKL